MPQPSVLAPADCFHTGIMVSDLDMAMQQLTEAAGYRWTTPMGGIVSVRIGSADRDLEFRMAYSVQAPHLELVQQIPGTMWMPSPGTAAHHLGYWVDDVPAASRRLTEAGFDFEAGDISGGEAPANFAYHNNPFGIRIEIVRRDMFGDWNAFLQQVAQ
jgi:hypothetical protein